MNFKEAYLFYFWRREWPWCSMNCHSVYKNWVTCPKSVTLRTRFRTEFIWAKLDWIPFPFDSIINIFTKQSRCLYCNDLGVPCVTVCVETSRYRGMTFIFSSPLICWTTFAAKVFFCHSITSAPLTHLVTESMGLLINYNTHKFRGCELWHINVLPRCTALELKAKKLSLELRLICVCARWFFFICNSSSFRVMSSLGNAIKSINHFPKLDKDERGNF